MINLLRNFNLQQPENATSDILAYLLNGIPAYKEAFLTGIPQLTARSGTIIREQYIPGSDSCRPDFTVDDKNGMLVIENKPWESSTLGSQLSDYAKAMKALDRKDKCLCLLATERNKTRLLRETADAETLGAIADPALEGALKDHYDKQQLRFSVLTWENVLDKLKAVQPENEAAMLWFKALRDYIVAPQLSPEDIKTREDIIRNWEAVKSAVAQIRAKCDGKLRIYGYDGKGSNLVGSRNKDEPDFCGWSLRDTANGIVYWIGAHTRLWQHLQQSENPEHCLFFLATWDKNVSLHSALQRCGFKNTGKNEHCFPLTKAGAHYETINPDEVARKITETLNHVRDALAEE